MMILYGLKKYLILGLFLIGLVHTYAQNRSFINSGFEPPLTNSTGSYSLFNDNSTATPGLTEWLTSATDNKIEIWRTGYNGVPAAVGTQFAELNANQVSRLYQNICLRNGETMNWSFYHRGRLGSDTMEFNIYNQAGTSKLQTIALAIDGTTNWGYYNGTFTSTLPSGVYQFSAQSIGAALGNQTNGNFLDEINIGLVPLVEFANATSAGLVTVGNNLPQLRINGTVPPGGSVVTLSVVGTGTTAINGIDYLLTTTVNVPAGEYNPSSSYITIPLTILNPGKVGPNTNIKLQIIGATNTMVVGDANCTGVTNNTTTYTIINTNCSAGHIFSNYLWYKADVGVIGTSTVSAWNDRSGNNFNLSNGTTSSAPTYLSSNINFNPAVYFNGVSNYLIRSSIFGVSAQPNLYTYVVARVDQVKAQSFFWETTSGVTARFNAHIPYNDGNAYYDIGTIQPAAKVGRVSGAWGGTIGTYSIWSLNSTTTASSPSGDKQAIYRNGLKISTNADRSDATVLTGNNNPFAVGRNESVANEYFSGAIAEISVFNAPLTASDQSKIQSYLATKYGITLDQTTLQNYVASNGTVTYAATSVNSGFVTNIAGIGRDDYSCLNQKQSQSINSGEILTLGLGTIAGDNASNPNSFSSDLSYFICGNNNGAKNSAGALDFGTTVNAISIQTRMNNVWKGQETGTVGSIQLKFSLISVPGVNGTGDNDMSYLRLLVDGDGVFATGATAVSPASFDNTNKTVTFNWDFSAATGFFFTLGSTNYGLAPLPISDINFVVVEEDEKAMLNWSSSNDFQQFEVFESDNAKNWETMAVIPVTKKEKYFEYIDEKLFAGANYYKLIGYQSDGKSVDFGVRYLANEHVGNIDWVIYPNPNAGNFQLTWKKSEDSQKLRVIIYNSFGQNVLETFMEETINKVSLKHLDAGVYHVEVEVDDLKSMKSLVIVD